MGDNSFWMTKSTSGHLPPRSEERTRGVCAPKWPERASALATAHSGGDVRPLWTYASREDTPPTPPENARARPRGWVRAGTAPAQIRNPVSPILKALVSVTRGTRASYTRLRIWELRPWGLQMPLHPGLSRVLRLRENRARPAHTSLPRLRYTLPPAGGARWPSAGHRERRCSPGTATLCWVE